MGKKPTARALGGQVVPGVVGNQVVEEAGVGVLADEALGDTDPRDGLGQRRHHAGEGLLHVAVRAAEAGAVVAVDRVDRGPEHQQ